MALHFAGENRFFQMMKRAGQEGLCTEEYEALLTGKRMNYPLSIEENRKHEDDPYRAINHGKKMI